MDTIKALEYINTDSPSTYEIEAQKKWIELVENYADEVSSDTYGNTFALLKGNGRYHYKVVIDAHCDEISWVVKSIDERGFLRVAKNGGIDERITPGQRVKVMGSKGKVNGFFGTTPIHLVNKDNDKKKNEVHELYVEVGAANEEEVTNMGIQLGDFIVQDVTCEIWNDKYLVGKSLDDKIGGVILYELLRDLKGFKVRLPFDLYLVNSVQEEVGLRGAKMISERIKPDLAICFDVTFDTNTPNIDTAKHLKFKMGDGVVLRQGFDVNHKVLDGLKKEAGDYKIQVGGAGGTNTAAYNLANAGIPTATVSIPLRYMHSPNEMVMIDDVKGVIDTLLNYLQSLRGDETFKLL